MVENLEKLSLDDKVIVFKQKRIENYLEGNKLHENQEWLGTIACRYKMFGKYLPQDLRTRIVRAGRVYDDCHVTDSSIFIENAGWHLTYFGGDECFRYKYLNFTHGNIKINGDPSTLAPISIRKESQTKKLKIYNSQLQSEILHALDGISHDLPQVIIDDLDRFYHLFRVSYH